MSRVNLENNLIRNPVFESTLSYKGEQLVLAGAITLAAGMPWMIALDPASTSRNVTMYTPPVATFWIEHQIENISTGTGSLNLLQADGITAMGSVAPNQNAQILWNPKAALWELYVSTKGGSQTAAAQSTISQYTTLAGIANAQVIQLAVPFPFKLNSVGFRVKIPSSTAAKLATLTGQVAGVSVTGGVVSLTTANTNTSGGLVAGTSITAGNVGAAGNTVGVLASAVTAFVEGDGYIEYNVTNTGLAA